MKIRSLAPATRPLVRCALLLLVPLAAGCYESPTPLGAVADATIDRALVGTWTCVDPKDAANRSTLVSRALDAHQYEVEWREAPNHVTRYRVHATAIGAETLLNVRELDTARQQPAFAFVKARVAADGTLTMAIVEADAVKPHHGAAAITAITGRVADPSLYGPFASCAPQRSAGAK
ncbi:MAG: hypothetical protein ABIT71_17630 [Vicinamibacteraceae bacterium]